MTATDESSTSASDTFALTVHNTNDTPILNTPLPDKTATEDAQFSFTFDEDTFKDVDLNAVITYTVSLEDDSALPAWLQFNAASRTFSGTPLNDDVGLINVKVTATDEFSENVSDIFKITIENTNDVPIVANPFPNQYEIGRAHV